MSFSGMSKVGISIFDFDEQQRYPFTLVAEERKWKRNDINIDF